MRTLLIAAATTAIAGCYTTPVVDSFKLDRLLDRTEKLEQKIDQLNEAMHSVTNQMFMIPVFPDVNTCPNYTHVSPRFMNGPSKQKLPQE